MSGLFYRVFRSGLLTLTYIITTVVCLALSYATGLGVTWKVLFTIFSLMHFALVFISVSEILYLLYNTDSDDDENLKVMNIVDVYILYIGFISSSLMIFWIWDSSTNKDTFFHGVHDGDVFKTYAIFLLMGSGLVTADSPSNTGPAHPATMILVSSFAVLTVLLLIITFAASVAVIGEVIRQKNIKNGPSVQKDQNIFNRNRRHKQGASHTVYQEVLHPSTYPSAYPFAYPSAYQEFSAVYPSHYGVNVKLDSSPIVSCIGDRKAN